MKSMPALLVVALIVPLGFALSVSLTNTMPSLFADEAVYHGMTASLAYDADLTYDHEDLVRIYKDFPEGPRGIILKQNDSGKIVFAKPFTYPLVAAIFYRILGVDGFVVLNCLAWWGIIWMVSVVWGSTVMSVLFATLFLLYTAFTPYVLWIHPEIFTAFCAAAFVFTWRISLGQERVYRIRTVILMGVFLALAVSIKPPLILLAAGPALDWMSRLRLKQTALLIAILVALIGVTMGMTYLWTGDVNPYAGDRKIFARDQYPLETDTTTFDSSVSDTWSTESAGFHFRLPVLIWNMLYFWVGRFTGLVWYFFPAVVVVILLLAGSGDRIGNRLGIALAAVVLAQLVLIPTNYHGGGGALGNRYFIALYPALLMCLPRPPGKKTGIVTILIAGLFSGPFLMQSFAASHQPGIHAQSGAYTILPLEWTLTGSHPVFQSGYRHVSFDGFDGFFYFMDRNTSGKEGSGFHVFGDCSAEILINVPFEVSRIVYQIDQAPTPVDGKIITGGGTHSFSLVPLESQLMEFPAGKGHSLVDIYGRERWIYRQEICINGGAIPKYLGMNSDSRFLGAFFTPVSVKAKQ